MGLLENLERAVFLGEEYLTWLWYCAETDPQMDFGARGQAQVGIAAPLVLRGAEDDDATQVTVWGERGAASAEARAALREGKKLQKCRLSLKQGDLQWSCAIRSDSFGVSGLGLPVPRGVPMPDGLVMRGERLEEFYQLYFAVFERFLETRLREKTWAKTERAMRRWVMQDEPEATGD